MPETSNTSFIPKRNPVKQKKRNSPRPMFIGTLLIRIFFFAVLIASMGVLIYETRLSGELKKEVDRFSVATKSFDEESMQKILNVDLKLKQIKTRLDHTASISSLFEAIELATIQTVHINNLEISRLSNTEFEITSEMKADSYDSILFQRDVLEEDSRLVISSIEELNLSNPKPDGVLINNANNLDEDSESSVNFRTILTVLTEKIPHSLNPGGQSLEIQNLNIDFTQNTEGLEQDSLGTDPEQNTNQIDL